MLSKAIATLLCIVAILAYKYKTAESATDDQYRAQALSLPKFLREVPVLSDMWISLSIKNWKSPLDWISIATIVTAVWSGVEFYTK